MEECIPDCVALRRSANERRDSGELSKKRGKAAKSSGFFTAVFAAVTIALVLYPSAAKAADDYKAQIDIARLVEMTMPKKEKPTNILYAKSEVNVRKKPNVKSKKLGSLVYGQCVKKTGIRKNGWTQIVYKGQPAYVKSRYLQKKKPILEKVGNVSKKTFSKARRYYALVSKNIRTHIENNAPWRIVCTNCFPRDWEGYLGLIAYSEKTIYLADSNAGAASVVHEMGHYFDHSYYMEELRKSVGYRPI